MSTADPLAFTRTFVSAMAADVVGGFDAFLTKPAEQDRRRRYKP